MKHLLSALIVLAACKAPPAATGPELEAIDNPPDAAKLIEAGRAKVQSGDPEAPILLKGSWRWRPPGQELRIWTLCQGEMDAQGCVLFVGRSGERIEVLAEKPIGWAPPKLRTGEGALIIDGEDGRSPFTRTLRIESGRPVIGPDRRPEGS
jgi:hypothetical protein